MKISLDDLFTVLPRPNITPADWHVSSTALLTASAIAARVSGHLAGMFVDEYVEVLRFRFLEEWENRTTIARFATVISFSGKKYEREIESPLQMFETGRDDGVNYGTVNDLADAIISFIRGEIVKIVEAQREGLAQIQRRLITP